MTEKHFKLRILEPAQRELDEIALVHFRLSGAKSARQITDKLYAALAHLQRHPALGIACRDETLKTQNYRTLICGDYLCFYRLIEDTVFIYHVVDGRADYPKLLKDLKR